MLPGRNLKAYFARMKNASLPEMVYRVNQAITVRRMRRSLALRKKAARVPPLDRVNIDDLRMPFFASNVDDADVQAILGGRVFTLNGERQALEQFERRWQGTYFAGIRLDPGAPDIRMVWEPARLQHLSILLVKAHENHQFPGRGAVMSFVREGLLEWIRQNPFLSGPHYMSPMECGLRMPVFFYGLRVLDNLSTGERLKILAALYLHAWWVGRNLSLYSSRGNHTICECLGLVFAGAVFRGFPQGQAWLVRGIRLLKEEAQRQILDDGGPLEQSLAYHRFVLDLYWLAVDFLDRNGLADFTAVKERLARGETFLETFRDASGILPAIGDSDDGFAIAPGIAPLRIGAF